jgi:hypothetical protein
MDEGEYERERRANIAKNKALMLDLGLAPLRDEASKPDRPPPRKKQKASDQPVRASARLASRPATLPQDPTIPLRPFTQDTQEKPKPKTKTKSNPRFGTSTHLVSKVTEITGSTEPQDRSKDIDKIVRGWSDWISEAPSPARDEIGNFHFIDFPEFQPNKSPAEILHEGAFGGSYYRPLYSRKLGITVRDDWRELPDEWLEGIDPEKYLLKSAYDASINKAGVACGQSIEEWEANGWIAHDYDVRGWFQWYTRFFQGRRCPDDDRQVGRWSRCVGPRGRWKRTLLKQYLKNGIRYVNDEGDVGEEGGEVSPVITQTCLHWAYEIRQGDVDEVWAYGL